MNKKKEYKTSKIISLIFTGSIFFLLASVILGNIDVLLDFVSSMTTAFILFLAAGVLWVSALLGIMKVKERPFKPRTTHVTPTVREVQPIQEPRVITPPEKPEEPFVGSKDLDKFHRSDCRWAKLIAPENRVFFRSAKEAKEKECVGCKSCEP